MSPESPFVDTFDDPEAPSVLSLDYYRQKALEFQQIVNALDSTARTVDALIRELPPGLLVDELIAERSILEGKKGQLKLAAEAINFAANGLNAVGVNFPRINTQTLGAVPLALAGAAAAAVAAAAALIVWGKSWIEGINQRLRNAELLASVPDADKGKVAQAILQTDVALAQANESPLASIAGMVKWIAIGAVAFFAYQAWTQYQGTKAIED
jgi:hypothetical protein